MAQEYVEISCRLLAALAAGGVIGIERSYRGRAAGFRTHALVCLASSLLMLVGVYAPLWLREDSTLLDPTRVAQGLMTGIGFLGAGAILKEGLTVRGLTTAASIWITAALGIVAGVGLYAVLLLGVALTLVTLSLFGWLETRMPSQIYSSFSIRFAREHAIALSTMREMIAAHGFAAGHLTYRLSDDGTQVEYRMRLRTLHAENSRRLFESLLGDPRVREFRIAPASE
jgi:putative Mg2+ transporter-C (MgtC) family protein